MVSMRYVDHDSFSLAILVANGQHLAKLGWCISAAQRLPPTLPKLPSALRLVAARRVPHSPRAADGILREPVQDLAALDDAILEQFSLPLWPKLQAVRVGDEVLLRNDGIGAAISARLDAPSPPNGTNALAPFDLPSGAQATLKVATSAAVMALTFSKYGSVRRVVVPIARDATAAVVASARTDALRRTMDGTRRARQLELRKKIDKVGIVLGTSPPILDVFEQIAHANMIDGAAHVLLLGETGVGKSMFARLVHQSSLRAEERYAEVYAAGTGGDVTLQIGTWVGYGKGHGIQGIPATGRDGHLVGAQRGALFIDEFALLSHDIQGVLLAVLEKKPTNKVGGEVAMLDVRCIFATNEDPAKLVKEGKLRADLLHRIGSRITIPPLRERIGDILLLARHFAGSAHPFSEQVELALLRYSWPGNIRELEALVKKAKAKRELDAARRITLEHIDLPEDLIAGVRTLSDEECQRELWALVDQVAQAEGYEHGTGLQKRAAEIMGVQQPQASKMYASHGLARAD
jgi:transcriptional regulator with PAS, ATPase and Fis domain